jgi:Alr-MurF fusion protein
MKWAVSDICEWTHGTLVAGHGDRTINQLVLDSRKALNAEDSLFIAIHGVRHNSHLLLQELYAKGVRCFIIEEDVALDLLPEADVVRVANSIAAMQSLAALHRSQYHIPVIGITGSNGKTTIKEWLNVLLSDDYHIVRSPKSYNSQIGVPISVWNMGPVHELAIFEAGISEPGEMEKLARVIQPTIGVLSGIGTAHMENFLSRKQLIGEKLHLFARSEVIIVPDDSDVLQLISPWQESKKIVIVPKHHWIQRSENGTDNVIRLGAESRTFEVGFGDQASFDNIATCIVCMRHLGYSDELIQDRLKRLTALEMRLQLIEGENGAVIVNDAYSNDLQSLEIALDFLSRHARGKEKAVVLSDFIQSGMPVEELHRKVHELLQRHGVQRWYNIGPASKTSDVELGNRYQHFQSTEAFLSEMDPDVFQQTAVLVKGARVFAFEKIVAALQEQSHDSVLQIDLGALVHNLNYFKSKIDPSTKLMVMVKAFGYGIGAPQVASLLMFNKADYLAVAYTDEGAALRKAGISLPIMVMNPERSSLQALIKFKLEPEIYSFRSLTAFIKALRQSNHQGPYAVHLKIDTGMRRLGFELSEIAELARVLASSTDIKVASIFTHLAGTDNPDLDQFTAQQLTQFEEACQLLMNSLPYRPLMHALNTGGIQRFAHAQYDMVRLGVGLYGVSADASEQQELMPVNALKTVISQIKQVKKGESIGYNRSFIAPCDMRSATIPLGYADGLRRQLSNGVGYVVIHSQRAPIVGNVCMDMTMIDVTHIDCNEGDAVEVFGQNQTIAQFAQSCGTIAYEVLTSISQRVKRVYTQD